jgi:hypothetical protein
MPDAGVRKILQRDERVLPAAGSRDGCAWFANVSPRVEIARTRQDSPAYPQPHPSSGDAGAAGNGLPIMCRSGACVTGSRRARRAHPSGIARRSRLMSSAPGLAVVGGQTVAQPVTANKATTAAARSVIIWHRVDLVWHCRTFSVRTCRRLSRCIGRD